MTKTPLFEELKRNQRLIGVWLIVLLLLVMVIFYGVMAVNANNQKPKRLIVYAFSTQQEVFTQGIFPAFEKVWKTGTGQDLTIEGIFGPSATLAGQINLGAPADVAVFSNAEHVNWLKMSRMVRSDNKPVTIGYTPIVIVVRPGNPANIGEFADLAQPGLGLIHPDPRSSGAGEWGVLAVYGNAFLNSQNDKVSADQLKGIWKNVRLLAPSARSALTLFELGVGDALITYEQDARLALARGVPLEIVIPPRTILAQPVAVIVDKNVKNAEQPIMQAFMELLVSDEGQNIFTRYQMRSKVIPSSQHPPLIQPFTVEDLGDWPCAYSDVIKVMWQTEIEPRLSPDSEAILLETGE